MDARLSPGDTRIPSDFPSVVTVPDWQGTVGHQLGVVKKQISDCWGPNSYLLIPGLSGSVGPPKRVS